MIDDVTVGHDGGLALAQVYASVESGISNTFLTKDGNPRDPNHPEVISGSLYLMDFATFVSGELAILDVMITAAGDLQVLGNPLTPLTQALSPMFVHLPAARGGTGYRGRADLAVGSVGGCS